METSGGEIAPGIDRERMVEIGAAIRAPVTDRIEHELSDGGGVLAGRVEDGSAGIVPASGRGRHCLAEPATTPSGTRSIERPRERGPVGRRRPRDAATLVHRPAGRRDRDDPQGPKDAVGGGRGDAPIRSRRGRRRQRTGVHSGTGHRPLAIPHGGRKPRERALMETHGDGVVVPAADETCVGDLRSTAIGLAGRPQRGPHRAARKLAPGDLAAGRAEIVQGHESPMPFLRRHRDRPGLTVNHVRIETIPSAQAAGDLPVQTRFVLLAPVREPVQAGMVVEPGMRDDRKRDVGHQRLRPILRGPEMLGNGMGDPGAIAGQRPIVARSVLRLPAQGHLSGVAQPHRHAGPKAGAENLVLDTPGVPGAARIQASELYGNHRRRWEPVRGGGQMSVLRTPPGCGSTPSAS